MELTATWREIVERELNTCKTTKLMDGLARTTKTKGKPGKGKAKQDEGKGKGKPGKGKGKSKSKTKGEQHDKKGKKGFHEMEGHEDKQEP